MHDPVKEFVSANVIVAAAETDDEIGMVLRIHLASEKILVWYIERMTAGDIKPYVKEPREFGAKLSLAAAFGLPVPVVRVIHQLNVIRNKLAHGLNSLAADQVEELGRQVDKLVDLDATHAPLNKRYFELSVKRPGEILHFGSGDPKIDFVMAALSFYGTVAKWAGTLEKSG